MEENVLEVSKLQKNFGKFKALKKITFEIKKGEVFGFIGPNGAGKSTTIRILLGILRASGGQAKIFGQDVWREAVGVHKKLAYVPGDVYLWPNLSGGEIIDLFLKLNQQKHTVKTDELIKQFELDPTKKARTYSKGNRQKVALIAAFSTDAAFYIFDEPTSGLDPLMEEVFQRNVLQLKQQGKSILLSSHILSEVEKMCDRIGIIRDGQIIETGTLAEMRHLTRTMITVVTKLPLGQVAQLPGVHHFKQELSAQNENRATFAVDSEQIGSVMAQLATYEIKTLQSTPPTLEDLFLRYYQKKEEDRHGE
ncbi:ATP-binding cassette domain-containing protein [Liquorilactobacillus satsumensis]|uniref:ABC transporter ATP-binding protein n=3 Tax=Liquorilactobacillus satsumensis TaxID=259059 RepID=A0A0R1V013_9LACO|nr:ABC transporter ATP-binding protein [Liquorilactobacillus satsumensis]KRL98806.1 ABC transporter ATP-binding protein [Liquorilactobacillus satsumensis DSM 16230 = JCM 12392]MCC7666363.1 ABC transporter ATP-binding protein [Liquorilactobacillus satsumensis]MCP9312719.1 ABC transporter ATP-binding protein [Liquorilactobacillus satsumensis]MCP9328015.1 ABC transporter ATP-binding protein [Liquorilactobacillus satsumensis]MCP9358329.1 ABC transporter ATP-binding protein [Liquorilactobacillus sa